MTDTLDQLAAAHRCAQRNLGDALKLLAKIEADIRAQVGLGLHDTGNHVVHVRTDSVFCTQRTEMACTEG